MKLVTGHSPQHEANKQLVQGGTAIQAYHGDKASTERSLVPVKKATLPAASETDVTDLAATEKPKSPYYDLVGDIDVRDASPRQMVELAMDLYVAGIINWDESAMMAFQPELQPEYDKTIGALTGEEANPDRPRDFVQIWEERLHFEKKYNTIDSEAVTKSQRIVDVLHALDSPPLDIMA